MKYFGKILFGLFLFSGGIAFVSAASTIQVDIDGKIVPMTPAPIYKDGRTLVPLRPLFEYLKAKVAWQDGTGIVTATKGEQYVRFTVGERFACLDSTCHTGALMDVPSQLINHKTYVPIRFISTALGAKVDWDETIPSVLIDTKTTSDFSVRFTDLPSVLTGKTILHLETDVTNVTSVKIYLLDQKTIKGPLVSLSSNPHDDFSFLPDPSMDGIRYMVAVVEENGGRKNYSALLPVTIHVDTSGTLTGVTEGDRISGPMNLQVHHTYNVAYIEYALIQNNGTVISLGKADPDKPFLFNPQWEQNGNVSLQALLYDRTGTSVKTPPVHATIEVTPSVRATIPSFSIGSSTTCSVVSNIAIKKMELKLDDTIIKSMGGTSPVSLPNASSRAQASFSWTPRPEQNGNHTLTLLSYDSKGDVYETDLGNVQIQTSPFVQLNIGPDQVIDGPYHFSFISNFDIVHFVLLQTDVLDNTTTTLTVGDDPSVGFDYTPPVNTKKKIRFSLQAEDKQHNVYRSLPITVNIVTTKTYGATPFGPQDQFRPLIEPLAIEILQKENMSASLQAAQAILESGWGQYLPTDRYTGLVSYNLFGIKGTGPAGTVVSKTSEVYGGIRYSVDANFRAYHNIEESWQDHANLLLIKSWYAPFRLVMFDPVQGAWGLYRSGYATTPTYAIQLINLMEQQNLWVLDDVMP
jgi:flagellum-specific peptidoglycan hydrolase FlgJ